MLGRFKSIAPNCKPVLATLATLDDPTFSWPLCCLTAMGWVALHFEANGVLHSHMAFNLRNGFLLQPSPFVCSSPGRWRGERWGVGGLVKREEMACFFAFLTLLDISMQQAHAFYWCACSVWESVCCCCHTRIVWERGGIAEIFIHGQDKCLIKQGDNWMACLFIQPTSKFNLQTPSNVRPYLILTFFFIFYIH